MSTTTKPRNDWDAIKLDYLHGTAVREIGKKYNIDPAQIVRKAKSKGWKPHNTIGKVIDKMVDTVRIETNVDDILDNDLEYKELENVLSTCGNTDIVRKSIIKRAIMQNKAFSTGLKSYQIIDQYLDITINNLKNSSNGLYKKGTDKFGNDVMASYADDLSKVIIPTLSESNKALGITSTQVAIQNNFGDKGNGDNTAEFKISNDPVQASKDYQKMINDK
jgi:hypothetical protein